MRKSWRDMTEVEREAKRRYDAAYRAANPDKVKAYRAAHPEKVKARKAAYRAANPDKIKSYRDSYRSQRNSYYKTRRVIDQQFRLSRLLSNGLRKGLTGAYKSAPFEKLLGCTFAELAAAWPELIKRRGLENAPPDQIHIDHFRPCDSYDLTDIEQQRQCFHWSNLRPMLAVDNVRKGTRRPTKAEIEEHHLLWRDLL